MYNNNNALSLSIRTYNTNQYCHYNFCWHDSDKFEGKEEMQ